MRLFLGGNVALAPHAARSYATLAWGYSETRRDAAFGCYAASWAGSKGCGAAAAALAASSRVAPCKQRGQRCAAWGQGDALPHPQAA